MSTQIKGKENENNTNTSDANTNVIVSVPTMCLHCHLIVELERSDTGDVSKDDVTWTCPRCNHQYPGKYWKIRAARKGKVVA